MNTQIQLDAFRQHKSTVQPFRYHIPVQKGSQIPPSLQNRLSFSHHIKHKSDRCIILCFLGHRKDRDTFSKLNRWDSYECNLQGSRGQNIHSFIFYIIYPVLSPTPISLALFPSVSPSLASFTRLCSLSGSVISPLSDSHFVSVCLISCLQFPSLSLLCYQLFILRLKHRTHTDHVVTAMLKTSALQDNTLTPLSLSRSLHLSLSDTHTFTRIHTEPRSKQIHSHTPTQ